MVRRSRASRSSIELSNNISESRCELKASRAGERAKRTSEPVMCRINQWPRAEREWLLVYPHNTILLTYP